MNIVHCQNYFQEDVTGYIKSTVGTEVKRQSGWNVESSSKNNIELAINLSLWQDPHIKLAKPFKTVLSICYLLNVQVSFLKRTVKILGEFRHQMLECAELSGDKEW